MKSIIKSSSKIRNALIDRIKDLGISQSEICSDALKLNMKIHPVQLCKYLSPEEKPYSLTEQQIIWMCTRYGIDISLKVGKPYIEGKEIKYKILPYSERESIKKLKELFQ